MKSTTLLFALFFCSLIVYSQASLTAKQFAANIGKGFDVPWSQFTKWSNLYSPTVPRDIKLAGFDNVRIRTDQRDLNSTFLNTLKGRVDDCLANNLYPIIAYQGRIIQDNNYTESATITHLTNWWMTMATTFAGYSQKLAFNLLVEISGTFKTDYLAMNRIYQAVYDGIRALDATRIIIFPPVSLSDPNYLQYLVIPGLNDPYTMAQWHFYAAGPSPDSTSKKYWSDGSTWAQRNGILKPINTAYQWSQQKNYSTWVGAWMSSNYNDGNNYTLEQQTKFASFMTRALKEKNIPWSINVDNKFYDMTLNQWYVVTTDQGSRPVLDAILDSQKISVYQNTSYDGISIRLGIGTYLFAQLGLNSINSLMIPIDYKVTLSSDAANSQTLVLTDTVPTLGSFSIYSIKVEYIPFI